MAQKASEVAQLLKPYIVQWINDATVGGGGTTANTYHSLFTASGLLGGGNLADDVTVYVDQSYNFNWTGIHTLYNSLGSQLKIGYSSSYYVTFDVSAGGDFAIYPTGQLYLSTADRYNVVSIGGPGASSDTWLGVRGGGATHYWRAYNADGNLYQYIGSGKTYSMAIGGSTASEYFFIGDNSFNNILTLSGDKTANFGGNVNINGHITFYGGTKSIQTSGASNILMYPGANLILDPQGNYVNPANNYDINLGQIDLKYLTLHAAELWVETLVAQNTIATIGGRILVGPTTVLTTDLGSASATDTTIYVKHNQMTDNDVVYMEANGKVEFMRISGSATGAGSPYSYTVVRNLDGTGANQWYAGDAIFNTGQTGNGFIDLYSLRSISSSSQYGPTIVGNVRSSSVYNDWNEFWAIGNLNGKYNYSSSSYGFAAGKYSSSTSYITIDSASGIRMMYGASTQLARWDISGSVIIGQTGASQSNLLLSSGCVVLRNNTTPVISLHAAPDSAGLIATFDGAIGITASGGIYQGTGTFTSPSTGMKFYNDSGIGRIVSYNDSASQVGFNTIGQLIAGAGNVTISASGIRLASYTGSTDATNINWTDSGSTILRIQSGIGGGATERAAYIDMPFSMPSGGGGVTLTDLYIGANITGGLYTRFHHAYDTSSYIDLVVRSASDSVYVTSGVTSKIKLTANGNISASGYALIGDHSGSSAGGFNNVGLTIGLGQSASNEFLSFKYRSSANHGITSLTDTDTTGAVTPLGQTYGGITVHGFSASTMGVGLRGVITTEHTAKTTAAEGGIVLTTSVKSGTTNADLSASANILVIRNRATTHFILDGQGNSYQDLGTAWTNFDSYDDVNLLDGLSANLGKPGDTVKKEFAEFIEEHRETLSKIGLVYFNDDGHHFVNLSMLQMLLTGAIRQTARRLDALEQRFLENS